MTDTTSESIETPCFSPDKSRAHELCLAASEVVAVDPAQAAQKLVDALQLQPSNMLAYHLLAELYQSSGRDSEAQLCRRSILPEPALRLLRTCHSVLVDVAADHDTGAVVTDRQELFATELTALPRPGGVPGGESFRPALFNEESIKAGPCFIDHIAGGKIWHDSFHTQVFNSQHQQVPEHTKADLPLIDALIDQHQPYPVEGRLFVIGARGAHNFYHWMADIAPKLAVLLQAGYTFTTHDRFMVAFADANFTRQILAQFGVAAEQVYESEKQSTYVTADELVVPFVDNKMGLTMGSWLPPAMCRHFLPGAIPAGQTAGQTADETSGKMPATGALRLFIAREPGASDGRRIENQAELVSFLAQYGFECIRPEKLTVQQQADLFSRAEIIVAAHGAALANIMFCSRGTRVIEFYSGHMAPCYWAVSALCGLEYAHVYCGRNRGSGNGRSENMTVPLSDVEVLFSNWFDSPDTRSSSLSVAG